MRLNTVDEGNEVCGAVVIKSVKGHESLCAFLTPWLLSHLRVFFYSPVLSSVHLRCPTFSQTTIHIEDYYVVYQLKGWGERQSFKTKYWSNNCEAINTVWMSINAINDILCLLLSYHCVLYFQCWLWLNCPLVTTQSHTVYCRYVFMVGQYFPHGHDKENVSCSRWSEVDNKSKVFSISQEQHFQNVQYVDIFRCDVKKNAWGHGQRPVI